VIVGADRIAANGDVANKIGTYLKALAARAAGVPFYVAAPRSTIDFACTNGADIPIEERAGDELRLLQGCDAAGRPGAVAAAAGRRRRRQPGFRHHPGESGQRPDQRTRRLPGKQRRAERPLPGGTVMPFRYIHTSRHSTS
jgi:hypothetical protein